MNNSPDTILLLPRPYAKASGQLLLLPLLPQRKALFPLPSELWSEIISIAFSRCREEDEYGLFKWPWSFIKVCKLFKEIGLPLAYSHIQISDVPTLSKLYERLHSADQKWDSIRRIPYSTPGRWIQKLNISDLEFQGQQQAVFLDLLLTQMFPLTPFLSCLDINPSFVLSRRALSSLAQREGSIHLRSISGLSYVSYSASSVDEDPFVQLFRQCPNLEVLDIIGQGLDPAELDFTLGGMVFDIPTTNNFCPVYLPKLTTLSLLSMHTSTLMFALLNSPLPNLKKVTITPYDDIPYPASLSSEFINVHGGALSSLLLFTPKSWPTRLYSSPDYILKSCPNLKHLSLETPLPTLELLEPHRLRILSIPRPKSEFWRELEKLFPLLPSLSILRIRDVRWLRKGISSMAQEAGVQGEMREWRRRLDRRRIILVDSDWRSYE